jgi:hypothetical protein
MRSDIQYVLFNLTEGASIMDAPFFVTLPKHYIFDDVIALYCKCNMCVVILHSN